MVEVERGEDVGLEVFVEGGGCYALDEGAGPVCSDLRGVSVMMRWNRGGGLGRWEVLLRMPSRCLGKGSVIGVAEMEKIKGKKVVYLAQRSGADLRLHSGGSRIRQCQLVGHRVGRCRWKKVYLSSN